MSHPGDVDRAIRDLTEARAPFAVATVVWTRGRSSGKAGDRAVVTPDGGLQGWIGGACAFDTVLRECREALASRAPRVLCIGRPDDFAPADEDGARVFEPATCASEGSYEIFVEPRLPPPQVVVLGDSPLAVTLGRLAAALGYGVLAGSREPGRPRPAAGRVVAGADLSSVVVDEATHVVVATQGLWDAEALRGALATEAPYVGLVASAPRWAKLRRRLAAELGEEAVARVRAPAGLDLGPLRHEEIAVAILAEIVEDRARARRVETVETVVEASPAPADGPGGGATVSAGCCGA